MKRLFIVLFIFGFSFGAIQSLMRSSDLGFITDTIGTERDSAFIYARFFAVSISFAIVSPDVWTCSLLTPGEDTVQNVGPIVYRNTGGATLDLGFRVLDEDIIRFFGPWGLGPAWTSSYGPDTIVLGLILTDNSVMPANVRTTEFSTDDILMLGPLRFYDISGRFRPNTPSFVYEHEGSSSLRLQAGPPGENEVFSFFRVIFSRSGTRDRGFHAVMIGVYARISEH